MSASAPLPSRPKSKTLRAQPVPTISVPFQMPRHPPEPLEKSERDTPNGSFAGAS
jgi:hypothetical protein